MTLSFYCGNSCGLDVNGRLPVVLLMQVSHLMIFLHDPKMFCLCPSLVQVEGPASCGQINDLSCRWPDCIPAVFDATARARRWEAGCQIGYI